MSNVGPAPAALSPVSTARPFSGPRIVLHLEGLAILIAASALYAHTELGWGWFAALFLLPDLAMLGYLAGPRAGSVAYNLAHNDVLPLALLGVGAALGTSTVIACAVIWLAHVGFDRMLGYGLKYAEGLRVTHLGKV